ncbi:MAG: hypothetical protein JRI23_23830 [Deltaproteobacteria bacterium]|nr:hypothetical protein [Deltaproteobacteria bacterium]MBW2535022.1 hypothetical protein [Deltaproteobacteria bacterium]
MKRVVHWSGSVGAAAAALTLAGCGKEYPDTTPPDRAFESGVEWVQRLGDTGDERIADVIEDNQGNLLLIGSFSGTTVLGAGQVSSAGADDVFLAKLDGQGELLWSHTFGAQAVDAGRAIATDGSGNVFAAGSFSDGVDFGGGALTAAGQDGFVVKLDGAGQHLWSSSIGGTGTDQVTAVVATSDGHLLAVGSFADSITLGQDQLTSAGDLDVFAVKLDPAGDVVWSAAFGGPGTDVAHAVTRDDADQLVITGEHGGSMTVGDTTLDGAGGSDGFVIKLSPRGQHVWSRSLGSAADDDLGLRAAALGGGALQLTGSFAEPLDLGGGELSTNGGRDIFVAKWSSNGDFAWNETFGDSQTQLALDVAVDGESNVHVAGQLYGRVAFWDVTRVESGGGDALVFRLGAAGNPLRINAFGDAAEQRSTAVAPTADGAVIVAGDFYQTIDFGSGPLTSLGERDLFIARLER